MSSKICRNCGGITNTAICDWIDSKDDKADYCYLRWENEKWVRGCAKERDPVVEEFFKNTKNK